MSDKDETTKVDVSFKGAVKGILVNHGDHGYAKVHFDKKSLDNFEQNLYKIEDGVSRSMIWQQLWYNMRDEKMTSIQLLNYMVK